MQAMPWIVLFHVLAACLYLQLEEFGAVRMAIGGASLWACSMLLGSRRPGAERWVRVVCGTLAIAMLVDVLRDPGKSCNIRLTMLALGVGCLTLVIRDAQSRWGRTLVRFSLLVASVLGTLTIVNSVMRFFHQADPYRIEPTADSSGPEALIHQPNDVLKWVFAKGFKGHFCHPDYDGELFETNADGFRDRPWPARPDPDALRILVLGDSIAVGLGVERSENFSSLLESLLTQKLERKVTVFNAAVSGYGPAEQLLVLESVIDRLDPNIVLATFYDGNDLEDMRFQFFRSRFLGKHTVYLKSEEKAALEPGQQAVDFWTKDQSSFYKFVSRTHVGDFIVQRGEQLLARWGVLAARGPVNWMLLDSMLENGPQEIAEWLRFAKLTFARMHLDCTRRGASLFVVRIPAMVQTSDAILGRTLELFGIADRNRFDRHDPGRTILADLSTADVRGIDCLATFEKDAHPENFYFQEGHLSRQGHVHVAESIASAIESKLLDSRR